MLHSILYGLFGGGGWLSMFGSELNPDQTGAEAGEPEREPESQPSARPTWCGYSSVGLWVRQHSSLPLML